MKAEVFKIEAANALGLHGVDWSPDSRAKAVVCLVHGLGEHSGRYDHVAEELTKAGYALVAMDLRGHGRSEGKRGHAPDYDALMSDIFQLLETAARRHPGLPQFLYGHSLGGNLVIHYALRRKPQLAGVIATAPLLRLAYNPPTAQTIALRIMKALRITIPMASGLDDTALSRDLNVVRTYRNDPLTHHMITPQLAVAMIENGEWNLKHAADFPCPLLLMHGDADRITSAEATREFAERMGESCTSKVWNGFYHELQNEPGKQEVFAYMLNWLDHCLSSDELNGERK